MLPDFSGLYEQSNAIAGSQPPEPKAGGSCKEVQSFLHDFCEKPRHFSQKVMHLDQKVMHFSEKCMQNAEKSCNSELTLRYEPAPQKTAPETSDPPPIPDQDHAFFDIWLAHPSWSPILLTERGWITVKGSQKKQVPLTFKTLESYYRRGHIIGKRSGQLTNYLMIDIDINSPFHPNNGGFQTILTTMEQLGLCRYLIVRSSTSGGLHLYFPLPEPVNSWQLAYTVHSLLTANGVKIAGGICELFPNKKSANAEHNGHRLPLQDGSFLLDNDFCPISNQKADFVTRWHTAAAQQDDEKLTLALSISSAIYAAPSTVVELPPQPKPQQQRPLPSSSIARATYSIPPIAWTHFAQSNEIMRELVNYGDRYAGYKNSTDLAAWMKAVAPQLPGYQEFASPKSKKDIEDGSWAKRWAESHFRSVRRYRVGGSDHNANVAADAKRRIFAALDRMCVDPSIQITELWKLVSQTAKSCFDLGVHWRTFIKYKDEIWEKVRSSWKLGLSSGRSEDVNSFSLEPPEAQIIEIEKTEKKNYKQLLTLRYAIAIYSNAFAQLHTFQNEVQIEGAEAAKSTPQLPDELATAETTPAETDNYENEAPNEPSKSEDKGELDAALGTKTLTAGQLVRIVMPGGSLDGIETRVLAQTVNVLGQPVYRLDYQRQGQAITLPVECLQVIQERQPMPGETAIKATAQQLLEVLGKACPFVGPGFWTVRREEVPDKAWRQLLSLVGET